MPFPVPHPEVDYFPSEWLHILAHGPAAKLQQELHSIHSKYPNTVLDPVDSHFSGGGEGAGAPGMVLRGLSLGKRRIGGTCMPFFQGQHRLCHSMLDPMPCSASPHIPALPFIPRHRLEEGQASSWTRRLKVFLCCTRTKDSQSVGAKNLLLAIKISVGEIPVFPQVRITFGSTSWAAPVSLYQPLPEHFSCCFDKSHILKEENLVMGKQKPGEESAKSFWISQQSKTAI